MTLGLRSEPGWGGLFTRQEADGAWANGTRVVQTAASAAPPRGTVLGSLGFASLGATKFFYFVAWDVAPRVARGLGAGQLRRLAVQKIWGDTAYWHWAPGSATHGQVYERLGSEPRPATDRRRWGHGQVAVAPVSPRQRPPRLGVVGDAEG